MTKTPPKTKAAKKKGPTKKGGATREAAVVQVPVGERPTPLYVVVATIAAIVAGLAVFILSFLGILPDAPQPQYNIVGLVMMSFGFILSTQIK